MIEMLPCREKEKLDALNRKSGVSAHFAYCMYEGGRMTGYLLYDITEEEGVLLAVKAGSDELLDGLVRAALGSLEDIHITRARLSGNLDLKRMERLGFVQKGENIIPDISAVFHHCKNCKM